MSVSQPISDAQNQPYAGDVSVEEAWKALESDPLANLVDVRTHAEWCFVGGPDLSSLQKEPLRFSWRLYPRMDINSEFLTQLENANVDKEAPLYFLCKVGGRSADAAIAATSAGWKRCYNIVEGFEGEPDVAGHRGLTSGWKAAKLPWGQN